MCRTVSSVCLALLAGVATSPAAEQPDPPNVIVVFCDDMGYGDIGPFGAEGYATPNLDRMAAEGMKFTDFYVGRSFCSPSRAALLTGCIPTRVGVGGNFGPHSKTGLHPDEMTLAEVVKQNGYATACFGKWHLGHLPEFLPTAQGFDEYFGIPYSNDMWPFHPGVRHLPMDKRLKKWPHLPLFEGTKVINPQVMPEDQVTLTRTLAEKAVDFIERHRQQRFFIYLPNPQPHVPLFASESFKGTTERGLYGDVIGEIDWGVGQIIAALKQHGLDEKTCIVFTSDNGPWLSYGDHAGSAGPLREGKGTNFEGGFRVSCLMRWPGTIPAGQVCREVASTIDLLPTFAGLCNAPLPNRKIDGKDIRDLMLGKPEARSPHDVFYHYDGGNRLAAIRSGKWKLMFPQTYNSPTPGSGGLPGKGNRKRIELSLFDLENDLGETTNVAEQHPEVVQQLQDHAEKIRQQLGDGNENVGTERRPLGRSSANAGKDKQAVKANAEAPQPRIAAVDKDKSAPAVQRRVQILERLTAVKPLPAYGVVVDEAGDPIEGVKVQAATPRQGFYSSFSMPTGGKDIPGKTAVTDADGRFRIDGIVTQEWRLENDGKVPVMLRFRSPFRWANDANHNLDEELRIVLRGSGKRGVLRLKLVDDQTGEPIQRCMVVRRHDAKMTESESTAGEYEVMGRECTRHKSYVVYCYAHGYEAGEFRPQALDPEGDERSEIRLRRRAPISFRIVDEVTGEPVPGAKVMSARLGTEKRPARYISWGDFDRYVDGYHSFQFVQRKRTSPAGEVDFCQLPEGESALLIVADGYQNSVVLPTERDRYPVVRGALEIGLKTESAIVGRLTSRGQSVADAEVSVSTNAKIAGLDQMNLARQKTDADGAFKVGGLRPGDYWLNVAGRGERISIGTETVRRDVNLEGSEVFGVTYPHATVRATPEFDAGYANVDAYSDSKGRYSMPGLVAGPHRFEVHYTMEGGFHDKYVTETIEVKVVDRMKVDLRRKVFEIPLP